VLIVPFLLQIVGAVGVGGAGGAGEAGEAISKKVNTYCYHLLAFKNVLTDAATAVTFMPMHIQP
jgi:hypothetical protein